MNEFAKRPADDRLTFINESAAQRDVTPIIIEKDFWVYWTLLRVMETPVMGQHLTFKGGTSLAKAYDIIERFSKDIDLTIGRDATMIVETKPPMEQGISGNERKRRTKALKAKVVLNKSLIFAITRSPEARPLWGILRSVPNDDLRAALSRLHSDGRDVHGARTTVIRRPDDNN